MKFLPDSIFSEFKDKVIEGSYYPTHPIETLKARLTATWLLQNPNPNILIKAKALLTKTSTFKEEDLSRLQNLASQTKSWDELQICSSYTNTAGTFLEYKLLFTTLDGQKQSRHYHALYEMKESHCCFVSQTPPLIRVAGDPVLQRPGSLFPEASTPEQQQELAAQIELAKSVLIQTSGAGIAANQCAAIENPYRFAIVGVFYEIPQHVIGVEKRYPGTKFPQAKIMLNPVITAVSKETQQFNHACLSVPCANRCAVLSPMEIIVKYQDPMDKMIVKEDKYTGIDAVVLWHELTHIVYGKTYMDVTFESLPVEDLLQFQKMLTNEMKSRQEKSYSQVPELSVPPFHFSVKINKESIPKLAHEELAAVLPKMSEDTLYGLLNQANELLKKKKMISNNDLLQVSHLSVFSSGGEKMVDCANADLEFRLAKL
jgi:peptide deformylase